MEFEIYIYFIIGFLSCVIGAVPLGLVNLSVAKAAIYSDINTAKQMALGASFVEFLFALLAVLFGNFLVKNIAGNPLLNYGVIIALLLVSLVFFFKKGKELPSKGSNSRTFLRGVFLNLISIQVLFFWLIAISLIAENDFLPNSPIEIVLFLSSVFLAKFAVLRFYILVGQKLFLKSELIASNINKVIGGVLVFAAVFQYFR